MSEIEDDLNMYDDLNVFGATMKLAAQKYAANPAIVSLTEDCRFHELEIRRAINTFGIYNPFEGFMKGLDGRRGYTPLMGEPDVGNVRHRYERVLNTFVEFRIAFHALAKALNALGENIDY